MSFVAISKVRYPAPLKEKIHAGGLKMLPVSEKQSGLIAVSFHQSTEHDETMMFWHWKSESDHTACMNSEDWTQYMVEHGSVFQSEGVQFSIETYKSISKTL